MVKSIHINISIPYREPIVCDITLYCAQCIFRNKHVVNESEVCRWHCILFCYWRHLIKQCKLCKDKR